MPGAGLGEMLIICQARSEGAADPAAAVTQRAASLDLSAMCCGDLQIQPWAPAPLSRGIFRAHDTTRYYRAMTHPPAAYAAWLAGLKTRIHATRLRTALAVNSELIGSTGRSATRSRSARPSNCWRSRTRGWRLRCVHNGCDSDTDNACFQQPASPTLGI